MINVNMTDKAGVTLATAGKYCADNVKVTPSAEILRKDEQAKTATPTTSAQDITPDAGKALSKVTVNPITAAIVGDLDADSFAASIVAAIEGKGVDVPSGAKLDALAALVESIQAGGGGLQNNRLVTVASGSFTVVERTAMNNGNRFILQHDAGVIPLLIYIQASDSSASGDFTNGVFWRTGNPVDPSHSTLSSFYARRASSSSYRYVDQTSEMGTTSGDDWTTDHVNLVCYNATVYFNSGITYEWYAYSAE